MYSDNGVLRRSSPEAAGVRSSDLVTFFKALDNSGIEFHEVTLIRHGCVIAQADWTPYSLDEPHMTHSLTKLFTNTAVGMACSEGLFSLDDKVVSFFPDEEYDRDNKWLNEMTVRDLITMRCGHDHLISGNKWRPIKTSWVAEFFKEPLAYAPGEHFQYTSATSYILSAIVQKVTGMTTFEYLNDRLLKDLGITSMSWDRCPHGICSGGNGITIKNEDAAKMGLLYLNDGVWNSKRYLSHEWVEESSVTSCKLNPDTGYGFHLSNENGIISSGGIFGQTVAYAPEYDLVLSINAACPKNRPNALDIRMRRLIDAYLLPVLQKEALTESPEAVGELEDYLSSLTLPGVPKASAAANEAAYMGTYKAEENIDGIKSLALKKTEDGIAFYMEDARGRHRILCGENAWITSESSMTGNYLHHQYQPESTRVSAGAWWIDENTLLMKWAWINMTFVDTAICHFYKDTVEFKRFVNVNTQDTERPVLRGVKEN